MTTATPTLTFEDTAVPTSTSSEPNPFEALFPTEEGKAKSLVLDGPATVKRKDKKGADVEGDTDVIKKLRRQARAAANAKGLTARVSVSDASEGKGKDRVSKTRFTVWTVKQVKRPRTTNTEDAAVGVPAGTADEAAVSAANPNTATQ